MVNVTISESNKEEHEKNQAFYYLEQPHTWRCYVNIVVLS